MSTLREAAAMAAKAIEDGMPFDHLDNVVAPALRAALAEPVQEPGECRCDSPAWCKQYNRCNRQMLGLPPAPPQRKPLTDEELEVLWDEATNHMEHFCSQYWDFARAIERAHGIGEQE